MNVRNCFLNPVIRPHKVNFDSIYISRKGSGTISIYTYTSILLKLQIIGILLGLRNNKLSVSIWKIIRTVRTGVCTDIVGTVGMLVQIVVVGGTDVPLLVVPGGAADAAVPKGPQIHGVLTALAIDHHLSLRAPSLTVGADAGPEVVGTVGLLIRIAVVGTDHTLRVVVGVARNTCMIIHNFRHAAIFVLDDSSVRAFLR